MFEKVLSIYEMAYGPDSTQLDVAGTLINLGSVLARKGDLDGAKCIYEKVLAVYEMTYGPNSTHPNVAKTFTNLGNVLFEKGDLDGAKSAY